MSTKENKAIVRRAFEELWNQRKLEVIDELWAEAFINPGSKKVRDKWKEENVVPVFANAPPDLHITIEDQIAEGDKVVTRWTWSFTHTVKFFGTDPTGKYISWTGISITRLGNGKILEEWNSIDNLGLQRQLGRIA
jgi:predicted ester cyclase